MQHVVITLIGNDRNGLVRALASAVSQCDGNWIESRLARLGGKFAGVVRVAIPAAHTAALAAALNALEAEGLTVWTALDESPAPSHRQAATLHLTGADKPGIVKQVAQALAEKGVNVEEFESSLGEAPWSGAPVFQATARLALPPQLALSALRQALEAVSADLMVDITVQTP